MAIAYVGAAMQIPETPQNLQDLDLMKRLKEYADGTATWNSDQPHGPNAREQCAILYTNLLQLNSILAPMLDKATAREMRTFTMHDRSHGQKVAHLMWHILKPKWRESLTPPEIGMMIAAAYLHDVGMALDDDERARRFADPELWERLELNEAQKARIEELKRLSEDKTATQTVRNLAEEQWWQAREAVLAQDTRERHATRERYEEILSKLNEYHQRDRNRIPDIESCLTFDGYSFREKLIDICVSHNEDVAVLVNKDFETPRFQHDYPVGIVNADLHMIAAALRLADILDFDRERTPPVMYHYLLPGTFDLDNRSVLEWNKHLTIANWHIEPEAVVFRGRSNSHIIHHAVIQFAAIIADEIKITKATFGAMQETIEWPFDLPINVDVKIVAEGYTYVPYRFELDDQRVYELLMGGAIYDNPLVAVRELVQNAVDACILRDRLTMASGDSADPKTENRILIRYEEPRNPHELPKLIIKDTGTGMDAWLIEQYFLKVGRSYYKSAEFKRERIHLRQCGEHLDFAPISEFGIGFLSSFLLTDRVIVETAMWEPVRGDTIKRTLIIDGPTRLIRLDEKANEGVKRFKGTEITLFLCRGNVNKQLETPPNWEQVQKYLEDVCQDLPYDLELTYVGADGNKQSSQKIKPRGLKVELPVYLEEMALHIPVEDEELGLRGELVIINALQFREFARQESLITNASREAKHSVLIRGGFRIGQAPSFQSGNTEDYGRLSLTWSNRQDKRYLSPNLARTNLSDTRILGQRIWEIVIYHMIEHRYEIAPGFFSGLMRYFRFNGTFYVPSLDWLESVYNALTLYEVGTLEWVVQKIDEQKIKEWEEGNGNIILLSSHSEGGELQICVDLLDLILPQITRRFIQEDGVYAYSPIPNWRQKLLHSRDYVSNRINWEPFTEFVGDINNLLIFSSYLNIRYQDRFVDFDKSEVKQISYILTTICRAISFIQPLDLNENEIKLAKRIQQIAGDLEVQFSPYENTRYRIGDFKI